MKDFNNWWENYGSAIRPLQGQDTEEFAKYITEIAWSNGYYKAESKSIKIVNDTNNCSHHFKGKECTICGFVAIGNIFDTIDCFGKITK